MILFVVLGLLVSVFDAGEVDAGVSMHNPFYCYSTDPIRPQTAMHSSMTSYEAVRRTSVDPTVSSCSPSRFWFLGRQGGMLPAPNFLQEMIDFAESSIQDDIASNYDAGRTTLCRQDFEAIRNWTRSSNFSVEFAQLATVGNPIAMQNIGRRYQQFFPTLLTEDYSPDRFHFRHCVMDGSVVSIRAFVDGVFGEDETENVVFENVPERDWFMMPVNFCPEFRDLYEMENQHELNAFRQGPEFEEMVEQVNRKVGFRGSNQLSVDSVLIMHEWCRSETADKFEIGGNEENVALCAPFSIAHHLLLEYYWDLRYFYISGYGVRNQRLIQNIPCGLMQDLLIHISTNNTDQPVRAFVTHQHLLISMLVTFGSFRDTWPLHQHNFAQQTTRQWLLSLIAPNAGNLAVIRYDCDDGDHDLLFLLNERPLFIPGCTENGICKLNFILDRFQRYINANCEERFCSNE